MNGDEGTNLDPVLQARRLAERFLGEEPSEEVTDLERELQQKLSDLDERKRELPSDDPLHRLYEDAIEWQQEEVETLVGDDAEAERQFLELTAEHFIAEGRWLDARIQRALNELVFDTADEFVTVGGTTLAPRAEIDPVTRAELSTKIRERAAAALAARDD